MELEQLLNELKKCVSELETLVSNADKLSGEQCAKEYVKQNELEYIGDEAYKAFKAGFLCCYRQAKSGRFDKED